MHYNIQQNLIISPCHLSGYDTTPRRTILELAQTVEAMQFLFPSSLFQPCLISSHKNCRLHCRGISPKSTRMQAPTERGIRYEVLLLKLPRIYKTIWMRSKSASVHEYKSRIIQLNYYGTVDRILGNNFICLSCMYAPIALPSCIGTHLSCTTSTYAWKNINF